MKLTEIKRAIVDKINEYSGTTEETKKEELSKYIDELHDLLEVEAGSRGIYVDEDEEIKSIKNAISEIKAERWKQKADAVKHDVGVIGGVLKTGINMAFPKPPQRDPNAPQLPRKESKWDLIRERAEENKRMRAEGQDVSKTPSSLDIIKARAEMNRQSGRDRQPTSLEILQAKSEQNRQSSRKPSSLDTLKLKAEQNKGVGRKPSNITMLYTKAKQNLQTGVKKQSSLDILQARAEQNRQGGRKPSNLDTLKARANQNKQTAKKPSNLDTLKSKANQNRAKRKRK